MLKNGQKIKITQIVSAYGPGEAFGNVAYQLSKVFHKLDVKNAVIT